MENCRIRLPSELLNPHKDARIILKDGYVWEHCPLHPACSSSGYVPQHRLVVERREGFFLQSFDHVHHIDKNKENNDPSNLALLSRSEHRKLHCRLELLEKVGNVSEDKIRKTICEIGLKPASRELRMSVETLKKLFPEESKLHQRKSPANLEDPDLYDKVCLLASDEKVSLKMASKILGISVMSIVRICHKRGVYWSKKRRVGETHRSYKLSERVYLWDRDGAKYMYHILASDTSLAYDKKALLSKTSTSKLRQIMDGFGIPHQGKSLSSPLSLALPLLKSYGRTCLFEAAMIHASMLYTATALVLRHVLLALRPLGSLPYLQQQGL